MIGVEVCVKKFWQIFRSPALSDNKDQLHFKVFIIDQFFERVFTVSVLVEILCPSHCPRAMQCVLWEKIRYLSNPSTQMESVKELQPFLEFNSIYKIRNYIVFFLVYILDSNDKEDAFWFISKRGCSCSPLMMNMNRTMIKRGGSFQFWWPFKCFQFGKTKNFILDAGQYWPRRGILPKHL